MGMVFGFKLHALTNLNGLFERWAFAAANHPDVTRSSSEAALVRSWLARELIDPESPYPQRGTPALGLEGQLVLGDKAYIGTGVLTPKRSNMRGGEVWTNSLDRARKRVESSFSTLVRSLTLHAAQVKTFLSLHRTRRVRPWVRL